MTSYLGKRVIVTGCFSGMGAATADLLAAMGAKVHGIDYKRPERALASFHQVDLRDEASIVAGVAGIGEPIDALFNCAGVAGTAGPIDTMLVNFIGTRRLTELAMDRMEPGGAIVTVSSVAGMGWPRRLATTLELVSTASFAEGAAWCRENMETVGEGYALSKEAAIVWSMVLSRVAIKRGIRVNCTMPGATDTPMMADFEAISAAGALDAIAQPIGRRATPVEQAHALVFLNSADASYLNGVALPVDGGFMASIATGQFDTASVFRRRE